MFDAGVVERLHQARSGRRWGLFVPTGGNREGSGAAVGARRPDVLFVDAPVSGSKGPAETGELLVLG